MDKRVLIAGTDDDTRIGTDFMDKYPRNSSVKKVDFDTERFPYGDGTFDDVISRKVIMHLKSPEHFLKECYRVLKNEGRIYITADNGIYYGIHILIHNISNSQVNKVYHLFTKEALELWLKEAGFVEISVRYGTIMPDKSIESEVYKDLLKLIDLKPHIIASATK